MVSLKKKPGNFPYYSGFFPIQGLHTKAVQTVAKTLNIPMDLISVKPSNTFVSPNNSATWGSTGTDTTCTVGYLLIWQPCNDKEH
jgi:hypothetical protein